MDNYFLETLRGFIAVAAGGGIGVAFGALQAAALRRNSKKQQAGRLKNGWTLFPGAGARTAGLLLALALVQIFCPILFAEGTSWLVSAGVIAGYGWMLYLQLREKLKAGGR